MSNVWKFDQVPLKFTLSDKTLLAPKIWLQVREVRLDDMQPVADLVPPSDPLEPQSQGFFIRSLPVNTTQPPVQHRAGYLCYVSSQYQRYYIDLQQSFADYTQRFSAKTRSTIKRKVKKYAEYCGGDVIWKMYQTPEQMREFFRLARNVSAKTYQEKILDAGLPESDEFLRDLETLAGQGQVRGYMLFDSEQPVSYLYCPIRNSVLRYQYLGYDPSYANWSVGTILHWYALKSIFAERCFRLFDFTEGQGELKRLFSTHSVQCANVFFLRCTVRNVMLVHAHRAVSAFSKWSGDVLDRYGAKTKIKKLIRFGR